MDNFNKNLKQYLARLDWLLIAFAAAAAVYGILLVKSATNPLGSAKSVIVQLIAAALGFAAMFIIARFDYEHILKYWPVLYAAALAALVLAIVLGRADPDAVTRRWINIPFIGLNVQPSEFVKVLYAMVYAKILDLRKNKLNHPLNVLLFCVVAASFILLIVDDLGSALVFAFMFLCMSFAAGVNPLYFIGAGAVMTVIVSFFGEYIWNLLGKFRQDRILSFLNPEFDPQGAGYHVMRSKMAIGSGGLFGQGFQRGAMIQAPTLSGRVPAQSTDFIFAVAGQEFGLIGCVLLIALLAMVIIRVWNAARTAREPVGSLICVGIMAMFMAQSVENIGMCLGLLPVTGITLPFFSYGGSSVLACLFALGIVQSVNARKNIYFFSKD